jgi:hypothetical protein
MFLKKSHQLDKGKTMQLPNQPAFFVFRFGARAGKNVFVLATAKASSDCHLKFSHHHVWPC